MDKDKFRLPNKTYDITPSSKNKTFTIDGTAFEYQIYVFHNSFKSGSYRMYVHMENADRNETLPPLPPPPWQQTNTTNKTNKTRKLNMPLKGLIKKYIEPTPPGLPYKGFYRDENPYIPPLLKPKTLLGVVDRHWLVLFSGGPIVVFYDHTWPAFKAAFG